MSDTILASLIKVLGGALFGFLIALYTLRRQRALRRVAYKKAAIRLLSRHDETPETIRFIVKKSVISGNEDDASENVEINSAYAHSVSLKNMGNTEVVDFYLRLQFGESARILSTSSEPSPSEAYPIKVDILDGNTAQIHIPYLNADDQVRVSVITTGETQDTDVRVTGTGRGVEFYKFKGHTWAWAYMWFMVFVLACATFAEPIPHDWIIPAEWLVAAGGEIQDTHQKVVVFPRLVAALAVGGPAVLFFATAYRAFRRDTF